jgi:hypothetical protein
MAAAQRQLSRIASCRRDRRERELYPSFRWSPIMKNRNVWLCTAALALGACSSDPATNTGQTPGGVFAGAAAPTGGSTTTPPPAAAGSRAPAGPTGAAGKPQTTVGAAGSGAPPAANGGTAAPTTSAGTGAITPVAGSGAGGATAPAAGAPGPALPTAGGAAPSGVNVTKEPTIPAVSGDCPDFKTGTASVGGLSGISMQVGAKKEGGGGPLVFYWHGTGSTAGEYSGSFGPGALKDIMDQGGMLVSFSGSTGSGGDCSGTGTFSIDDFKIADTITACAVKNYGIDPHKIYTTGCSAGGLMAGCMGIQRSGYIAASAPNSGGITVGYGKIQDPAHMPAVMTMHGSAADMVIVTFSETSEAYDNYMMAAGSFVINCNHGGGHCGAPADLQASAWQFMKDHPFATSPSPYAASGIPSTFPDYCKIWVPTSRKPLGGM